MHLHIVEQRRARASGPLTEAAPIVNDRDPFRVPRHESDCADIVLVIGDDRDPMREQHASGIEFAPVEAVDRTLATEPRCVVMRGLGASFRKRVAEPLARQHASVEEALLLLRPLQTQALEHEEVVLRNLADRAIRARERGDNTRDGYCTHAGSAIRLRDRDREQALRRRAGPSPRKGGCARDRARRRLPQVSRKFPLRPQAPPRHRGCGALVRRARAARETR